MLLAVSDQVRSDAATVLALVGASAVVAWFLLLGTLSLLTRPRFNPSAAPTMDLGLETPAVASFLVHRWRAVPEAAPATLVDLAARDHLALEQVGTGNLVVRLTSGGEGDRLAPYEQRVLDHVRRRSRGGVVPAGALDLGEDKTARAWWKGFRSDVVKEARHRGLAKNRWSTWMSWLLGLSSLVPGALLAAAIAAAPDSSSSSSSSSNGELGGYIIMAVVISAVLDCFWLALRAERDTPAGRAVASRWLGVRDYMADHGRFESLPAASVAIWDRYLAYAAAMGLARSAVAALPFVAEDPKRAWSAYSGTWRLVRIRRPGPLWPGWGTRPWQALAKGLLLTALAVAISVVVLPLVVDSVIPAIRDADDPDLRGWRWAGFAALAVPGLVVTVVGLRGILLLSRAVPDMAGPAEVEGCVLRLRSLKQEDGPLIWHIVVDDGRSTTLDTWRLPDDLVQGHPEEGQVVQVRVARRLGYVFATDEVAR